jgi:hypothetical protein
VGLDPRLELSSNPANTIRRHGMRSSCDGAKSSRANESIPNPRHRAKTVPREQSKRFPSCNLTCKRKRDQSVSSSRLFTIHHHRGG